jgi:hypothetical protein
MVEGPENDIKTNAKDYLDDWLCDHEKVTCMKCIEEVEDINSLELYP